MIKIVGRKFLEHLADYGAVKIGLIAYFKRLFFFFQIS